MGLRDDNEALQRAIDRGLGSEWMAGTLSTEELELLRSDARQMPKQDKVRDCE